MTQGNRWLKATLNQNGTSSNDSKGSVYDVKSWKNDLPRELFFGAGRGEKRRRKKGFLSGFGLCH